MDLCKSLIKTAFVISLVLNVYCLKFEDGASGNSQQIMENVSAANQQGLIEGRQSARHLFDFVGLGTGGQVDPFLRKTNEKCLNGELAECFKSQALNTFDDFFKRDVYV